MTLDRVDSVFGGKIQPAASVSCLSQCQTIFGKRLKRWGSTGSWVSPTFLNMKFLHKSDIIMNKITTMSYYFFDIEIRYPISLNKYHVPQTVFVFVLEKY